MTWRETGRDVLLFAPQIPKFCTFTLLFCLCGHHEIRRCPISTAPQQSLQFKGTAGTQGATCKHTGDTTWYDVVVVLQSRQREARRTMKVQKGLEFDRLNRSSQRRWLVCQLSQLSLVLCTCRFIPALVKLPSSASVQMSPRQISRSFETNPQLEMLEALA